MSGLSSVQADIPWGKYYTAGGREPEFYEQMGWIFNELVDGLNNKMIWRKNIEMVKLVKWIIMAVIAMRGHHYILID